MHTMLDPPRILGVALQDAEQPVVHPATLNPDLVVAGHVAMHCLPLAPARERMRRRSCHGIQDGMDLCSHAGWNALQEVHRWHVALRVISSVALKEVDPPRIRSPLRDGAGHVGQSSGSSSPLSTTSSDASVVASRSRLATTSPTVTNAVAGSGLAVRISKVMVPPSISQD